MTIKTQNFWTVKYQLLLSPAREKSDSFPYMAKNLNRQRLYACDYYQEGDSKDTINCPGKAMKTSHLKTKFNDLGKPSCKKSAVF